MVKSLFKGHQSFRDILKNNYAEIINDTKWFSAKLSFSIILTSTLVIFALPLRQSLYPSGIGQFVPLDFAFSSYGKPALFFVIFFASIMYVFDWKMTFATGILFLTSMVIVTFHESNGIFARATILSAVLGAQFFSYLRKEFDEHFDIGKFRYQYSVQMVAAGYVLAGIAKVNSSGLGWFLSSDGFVLQIIKNFYFLYSDTGDNAWIEKAQFISHLFILYPFLPKLLLLGALFLELLCFVVLLDNKVRLWWGFGLLLMHIGIAYLMGIGISVIAFPMVIFFINPLYLVYKFLLKFKRLIF